jgi:hypothetical protein
VLLIAALVLLRLSVPAHPGEAGAWLTNQGRRTAAAVALNLIPFAGIAFLWFIGVLRDRIGEREDRFFATVFLGSGLLFVGMRPQALPGQHRNGFAELTDRRAGHPPAGSQRARTHDRTWAAVTL